MLEHESHHDRQVAELKAVLDVSRQLAAMGELLPLLQMVERAARQVLSCERATIFLYDRDKHELYSRLATGVEEIRFDASRGIAGEVVRTGEVINVPDAYADPRFNPEIDRKTGFRTRNMVTFPLRGFDNTIVGVLQVLNKSEGSFDPWDRELVETFGSQVGVAVQRQLLLEHYAEKPRIQRDLSIARDIQQGLIPREPAKLAGFDIAAWNKPADETGGDCYDYLELGDGHLAVMIADATGHGIGPALMIAECRALFRATVGLSQDLTKVVNRVNDLLCQDLLDDRFVTSFFGLISESEGALSFISAGHGPLLRYSRAEDRIEELKANGVPLGILSGMEYPEPETFAMRPGDMMIVITDGFFEWNNRDREQYGIERLCERIRALRDESGAEIIQGLYRSVLEFAGGEVQGDDLTAMVIKKI